MGHLKESKPHWLRALGRFYLTIAIMTAIAVSVVTALEPMGLREGRSLSLPPKH